MLLRRISRIPHGMRRRFASARPGPKLVTALLCALVLAVGGAVVLQERRTALEQARASAANLAALLQEQTTTAMRTTDLALRVLEGRLESEDLPQDDARFRNHLRMMSEKLDYVRALYVIGADGFITHDTDYPTTPRVTLADRTYFKALQGDSGASLFIGQPVRSRSVQRWFVPVARRIDNPDGSFAGIVVAAVEPLFIERTFGRLQLREHEAVALFNDDSTLIARFPPRPELYGRRLDQFRLFTDELAGESSGVYQVRNLFSGRESIIGFERLADFPLAVTALVDRDAALSGWRRLVAIIGLACLSIVTLILLLHATWAKRRLEIQVAEQKAFMHEKLESIGYMTSSVAHDFRNLLAAILAGVRLVRKRGPQEDLLAGIEEAAERGDRLTADLLQFAKDQNVDSQTFDPNARIKRLATLLRQTAGPAVSLHLDLAREIEMVEASPAFFDASLINLAVNSSHAMPDGGELRISTDTVSIGNDRALPAGEYVDIRVADTGRGISSDKLDSVFEPFVTSKGRDGTGLGLFQVRRFATGAGGDARITSEPGKGTAVDILLPAVPTGERMPVPPVGNIPVPSA